jgi:hypothetical protein
MSSPRLACDAQSLHFGEQGGAFEPQSRRRPVRPPDHPARVPQHPQDALALDVLQHPAPRKGWLAGPWTLGQHRTQDAIVAEDDGTLDDVLMLTPDLFGSKS